MKKSLLLNIAVLSFLIGTAQQKNYLIVAKDRSGNYTTVQQAFNAVPLNNKKPITIFVKDGVYKEKLRLDSSKNFVTLIGEDRFKTILTYDDHTGKITLSGDTVNTKSSHSFLMEANNFTANNITFQNDAGYNAGQAVAVEVRGDKAMFVNCRFIGSQDVLFTNNKNSHEYYKDCYIQGTTDFIFGNATAWFEHCHIHSKKNSHVTAASTPQNHQYGYVFYDCVLTGDTTITNATLGRPWRDYASVTYLHCYIGPHIRPQGWSDWNNLQRYKTARFSEYENYGPGADTTKRLFWIHQLTDEQAKKYTIENVLHNWRVNQKCE